MIKFFWIADDGSIEHFENPTMQMFGLTEIALPLVAGLLTSAGVGATTAGAIASVAAPALVHAGIGAAGSAIMGGDPGQGALLGGISGGLGPLAQAVGLGANAGQAAGAVGALGGGIPAGMSQMDDGSLIPASPATSGMSQMDDGSLIPAHGASAAASGGQSPLAAFASKAGGGGASGPFAILAALAQNANRPSTTAPQSATANMPFNPTGYLNRTPTPNYAPAPGSSYYTYGQQAQPQFYSGNQLNLMPHMANGGALSHAMAAGCYAGGGPLSHGQEFSTGSGQNYVEGDGDGQSDEIPARLSDGEYVVDATTVSRLGNGSSDAGAKKLDQMRQLIAQNSGSDRVVQRKTRSPLEYLQKVA